MTCLLVAFALLCQGEKKDEAADLLKKVGEKFSKAKGLHIKAAVKFTEKEKTADLEIEVWIKGDKVKVHYKGDMGGEKSEITLTCDGTRMATERDGKVSVNDAPKDYAKGLRTVIERGGAFFPVLIVHDSEADTAELLTVSDAKSGKDETIGERTAKVVTYTITIKDDKDKPAAKLWIDAETLAPLKRELTGDKGESLLETYSTHAFDEEIKDDVFNLPKEK